MNLNTALSKIGLSSFLDKVFANFWATLCVCVSGALVIIAVTYLVERLFLPKDYCDCMTLL
jgi:hypothetical protein